MYESIRDSHPSLASLQWFLSHRRKHQHEASFSGSELVALLSNLCFLRLSWHGPKNLCIRASSAVILHLGFTVKHLSRRSKRESGTSSRNSGLFVFIRHQSLNFMVCRNRTSSKSCSNKVMSLHSLLLNINNDEYVPSHGITEGYEDSQLCSLATSHRSSLPLSFAISFIFLLSRSRY